MEAATEASGPCEAALPLVWTGSARDAPTATLEPGGGPRRGEGDEESTLLPMGALGNTVAFCGGGWDFPPVSPGLAWTAPVSGPGDTSPGCRTRGGAGAWLPPSLAQRQDGRNAGVPVLWCAATERGRLRASLRWDPLLGATLTLCWRTGAHLM